MRYGELLMAAALVVGSVLFAGWEYSSRALRTDVPPGGNFSLRPFVLQTEEADEAAVMATISLDGPAGYADDAFYTDAADGAMTLAAVPERLVFLRERTDGWDTEQVSILRGEAAVLVPEGTVRVAAIQRAGDEPLTICSLDYSAGDGYHVRIAGSDGQIVEDVPLLSVKAGERVHFTLSVRRALLRVTVEDRSCEFWLPPVLAAAYFSFSVGGDEAVSPATARLKFYDLQLSHKRI